MRYSLILSREHGEKLMSVLVPPGVPTEVNAAYKKLIDNPGEQLAHVELVSSNGGRLKRKFFAAPPGSPAGPAIGAVQPQTPAALPVTNVADDDGPTLG